MKNGADISIGATSDSSEGDKKISYALRLFSDGS